VFFKDYIFVENPELKKRLVAVNIFDCAGKY